MMMFQERKIRIEYIAIIFFMTPYIVGCNISFPERKSDYIEIYSNQSDAFRKIISVSEKLAGNFKECEDFRFEYTRKSFIEYCGKWGDTFRSVATLLSKDERKLFGEFMYEAKIHNILVYQDRVMFIFFGDDNYRIIKTRVAKPEYSDFKIDSLIYLVPTDEL